MKCLRSVSDRDQAQRLRQALENADIACVIRRESMALTKRRRAARELALEVCVEDEDLDRAVTILAAIDMNETPGDPWSCGNCEEELGADEGSCWQCGERRG